MLLHLSLDEYTSADIYPGEELEVMKYWMSVEKNNNKYKAVYLENKDPISKGRETTAIVI